MSLNNTMKREEGAFTFNWQIKPPPMSLIQGIHEAKEDSSEVKHFIYPFPNLHK